MGLDMYLYQNKEVPENLMDDIKKTTKGKPQRITSLVAEWRKANQIHNYFVNEVGDGYDDQRPIHTELSDIVELCDRCEKILEHHKEKPNDHKLAKELLPTLAGFFFGETEYDEYYYKQLEETLNDLKPLLFNEDGSKITNEQAWDEDLTFTYECSW